jgi:hypothetical protein
MIHVTRHRACSNCRHCYKLCNVFWKNDSHCGFPAVAGIKQTDWQLFGFTTHSLMVCFYHRAFEKDRKKSIYIQVTSGIMGVGSSLWSYYQTTCSNMVAEICNITCVVNVWNVLLCFSYNPKMKKCGTSHQNFRQPVITLYRKENSSCSELSSGLYCRVKWLYNPEDSSEHHTRRRENLKSHKILLSSESKTHKINYFMMFL